MAPRAGFAARILRVLLFFLRRFFGERPVPFAVRSRGRRVTPSSTTIRARRKPDWVIEGLIGLAALMPGAGCRRLADTFNRCHGAGQGISVGKSFVAEVVRREHWRIAEERRHIRRRQAGRGAANRVWGLDLTGKADVAIFGLIDHGTRRVLSLKPLACGCAWTMLGELCLAIGRFGKPASVRTDNAPVFISHMFTTALALFGIRHQRTLPGCPWQNGRIERLFGTLKAVLDRWAVSDRGELARALGDFVFWYNAVRPHQALRGLTPLEAWQGIDPEARPGWGMTWFSAWDGLLTGVLVRR